MKQAKPRGFLGTLLVFVGLAAILVGLGVVAVLGLSWHHYSNTPDFLTYLRSNPVDIGVLDERLVQGEALLTERSFQVGELDPYDVSHTDRKFDQVSHTLDVDLEHGDDSLLRLRQRLLLVLNGETSEHLGFRIETPQLETHEDMRVLVVVRVGELEQLVGEGSRAKGWAVVDVFVAAGAGESRVWVVEEGQRPDAGQDVLAGLGLPSRGHAEQGLVGLLSQAVPKLGAPPVIGLVHHVRQYLDFGWKRVEGGAHNSSSFPPSHSMTTHEYSYELNVSVESKGLGSTSKSSSSLGSTFTWNDEVW